MDENNKIVQLMLSGHPKDLAKAAELWETQPLFREIEEGSDEEQQFRQWAQNNYEVGEPISELWHPIVKHECFLMCQGFITDPEKRRKAQEKWGVEND